MSLETELLLLSIVWPLETAAAFVKALKNVHHTHLDVPGGVFAWGFVY